MPPLLADPCHCDAGPWRPTSRQPTCMSPLPALAIAFMALLCHIKAIWAQANTPRDRGTTRGWIHGLANTANPSKLTKMLRRILPPQWLRKGCSRRYARCIYFVIMLLEASCNPHRPAAPYAIAHRHSWHIHVILAHAAAPSRSRAKTNGEPPEIRSLMNLPIRVGMGSTRCKRVPMPDGYATSIGWCVSKSRVFSECSLNHAAQMSKRATTIRHEHAWAKLSVWNKLHEIHIHAYRYSYHV